MLFYAHRKIEHQEMEWMCMYACNKLVIENKKKIQMCLRDIIENPSLFIKFRHSIRQNVFKMNI